MCYNISWVSHVTHLSVLSDLKHNVIVQHIDGVVHRVDGQVCRPLQANLYTGHSGKNRCYENPTHSISGGVENTGSSVNLLCFSKILHTTAAVQNASKPQALILSVVT